MLEEGVSEAEGSDDVADYDTTMMMMMMMTTTTTTMAMITIDV